MSSKHAHRPEPGKSSMILSFDKVANSIEQSPNFKNGLDDLMKNQQLNLDSCQRLKKKITAKRMRNAKRRLVVKVHVHLCRFCSFTYDI